MLMCLDCSGRCTGWAKFTKDGKLMSNGRISPDQKLSPFQRIHYVTEKIQKMYGNVTELVIEDLYFGINPKATIYLARLSGAIIYSWMTEKYKEPIFYNASHARALVGINGHSLKPEIQSFIIKKYKFAKSEQIKEYESVIEKLKEQLKNKEIKRGSYKYKMNRLSSQIFKETGYDENICDSILLGIAFFNIRKKNEYNKI